MTNHIFKTFIQFLLASCPWQDMKLKKEQIWQKISQAGYVHATPRLSVKCFSSQVTKPQNQLVLFHLRYQSPSLWQRRPCIEMSQTHSEALRKHEISDHQEDVLIVDTDEILFLEKFIKRLNFCNISSFLNSISLRTCSKMKYLLWYQFTNWRKSRS